MIADGREVPGEIARRDVAAVGVLGEATLDDPAQWLRGLRVVLADRVRFLVENRRESVDRRLLRERPSTGRHLVKDGSEGELVRSVVDGLAGRLLRGHIAHGAE
jgi:hypothetical protein